MAKKVQNFQLEKFYGENENLCGISTAHNFNC